MSEGKSEFGYGSKYHTDKQHELDVSRAAAEREVELLRFQEHAKISNQESLHKMALLEAESRSGRRIGPMVAMLGFLAVTEWAGYWYFTKWLDYLMFLATHK